MIKIYDDHIVIFVSRLTREWAFDGIVTMYKNTVPEEHRDKPFIVQHFERETTSPVKIDTSWHKHFG